MCKSVIMKFGAALVLAMAIQATPAAAVEQAEAVKLCKENPNCTVNDGVNGNKILVVANPGSEGNVVVCPPKGNCSCSGGCNHPTRTMPDRMGSAGIAGILTGAQSTLPVQPQESTPGQAPPWPPFVRDHRR